MPSVEVLIPWLPGCPHRDRALRWVLWRYDSLHPDWTVTLAEGEQPWSKGTALSPALARSEAEIVVVADADVWTDATEAVNQVQAGDQWAIPHKGVHRLTQESTTQLLAGAIWEDLELEQHPYRGVAGGGVLAAPRATLLHLPLDARFVGWGQEDESWGYALETLLGPPWRGKEPLVHLWHPPQQRITRARGSIEGWRLRCRYVRAKRDPAEMLALVKEAKDAARSADQPAVRPVHSVR